MRLYVSTKKNMPEESWMQPKPMSLTYGLHQLAMFRYEDVRTSFEKTTFTLVTPEENLSEHPNQPVHGDYNVSNITAALAVIYSYGLDLDLAIEKLRSIEPIEGRMVMIDTEDGLKVIVDFAHTPNALESLLSNIRSVSHHGRILLVFGSAGERDVTKRPLMGQIAEKW